MTTPNLYYLTKTKQICHLLPWIAETACPWNPGYARILIPLQDACKGGERAIVEVIKASKLQKVINNNTLPHGTWIHLTH